MARVMEIATPLGGDVLLFHRMHASEELGRLSEYQLDLLSTRGDIKFEDILGKAVTVKLELAGGAARHFNGYVVRFAQVGTLGRYHLYRAEARPWLWFLTRSATCRIFQNLSVPEIVKKVFDGHPKIAVHDFQLMKKDYRKWEYCVQYRESDFNFISRLLEQEGIYYYVKHAEGKHTVVLNDSFSAATPVKGYESIALLPPGRTVKPEQEYVRDWDFARAIQAGIYALDDFDFKKPAVDLQVKRNLTRTHELADLEVYDYPGEYVTKTEGEYYAQTRLEELQTGFEQAHGATNARGMTVGHTFKLTGHARADQNEEYLVRSGSCVLEYGEYEAMPASPARFSCSFAAVKVNNQAQFRPERLTPKPTVQGPQTAIVVGPAGDEIHTDEHGRVKVQFHWDRLGKNDDNSSCWIRVSHPWAGKNWGMIAIPRIGQEVIVDFLEGDPDAPIVTGRVYNADQMPPWALPANKTQTGVLTRSSKGGAGANANAIRFEDKKGEEQLWIHAEKNQDIEVENDETHWVGHDRKKTIDNDENVEVKNNRTEKVGANEKITIGANRTESVGANEKITIGASRTENVAANENITIGANRTESVGASENISIGANQSITVGAARTDTVGASVTQTIGASLTQTVGGALSQTVAGGISVTTPAACTINAAGGFTVVAPGGTKFVDNQFFKVGASDFTYYSFKGAFTSKKIDITVNSISAAATVLTASANKIEVRNNYFQTKGNEIKTVGQAVKQVGATMILAGMFGVL